MVGWQRHHVKDEDILRSYKPRRPFVLGHVTCHVCAFCFVLSERLVVLATPGSSRITETCLLFFETVVPFNWSRKVCRETSSVSIEHI